MAKNNSGLVVSRKPNKIIEARQGLSVVQHKILFSVFAQFRTYIANKPVITAEDFKDMVLTTYSVKLSDIIPELKKQKAGVDSALYKHIDKEVSNIMKQIHEVRTEDRWEKYSIVDTAIFHKAECRLEIRIATGMMLQILKWFTDGHTRIPMKEIMPLRSKYAISIFENLLRVMNIPGVKENGYTISYEELRKKLGISPNEYKEFFNFDIRILQQAQKEIHEKTFMRFEYRKVVERFPPAINICFSNIIHNVKEVLPVQLEMFDFEKMEVDEAERAKTNATAVTAIIENSDKKNTSTKPKWTEEDRKWQREIDEDIIKDLTPFDRTPEGYLSKKFTDEQVKKLDKYLDGIFDAVEVKMNYDFDYIEFYYNKAVEKSDKGNIKDFAGFLYKSLLTKDPANYYELKAKEAKKQAEQVAQRNAEIERRKAEKENERIKKEKEAADIKRRIALFNSLDDSQRERYLKEFYATNQFYKDVIDKDGISEFTKISIGQLLEK